MIGLVLAAGFGTRFRPATLSTPKPLLPFLGRPMVFFVLDRLVEAGVTGFAVNAHHLAGVLEEGIGPSYRGLPVSYSREEEILGTAGGIRRAAERGLLGSGRFLVANGDVYSTLPLARLVAQGERSGALSVLGVVPNTRPEVDTPLWADAGGRLVGVGGARPDASASGPWLFTGLQSASPELPGLVPPGVSELARDLLGPSARRRDGAFRLVAYDVPREGLWFDLGSPARLAEAEVAAAEGAGVAGATRGAEGVTTCVPTSP